MKRTVVLLMLLVSIGVTANAQKDTLKVKGEVGLRGLWQTGTLNQLILTPTGKLSLDNNTLFLEENFRYDFFLVNSATVKNDLWTDLYIQHNPNKVIYPFLSGLTGFSESFRMDYSTQIALGAGVNVVKRKSKRYFQTNIGLGYFNLKYEQHIAHHSMSFAPMIRARTPIGKRLAIIVDFMGYLSLMDTDYFGLHNQISLHMFISKGFSVHLNHTTIYNSVNPMHIAPTNTKMVFGATYSFSRS